MLIKWSSFCSFPNCVGLRKILCIFSPSERPANWSPCIYSCLFRISSCSSKSNLWFMHSAQNSLMTSNRPWDKGREKTILNITSEIKKRHGLLFLAMTLWPQVRDTWTQSQLNNKKFQELHTPRNRKSCGRVAFGEHWFGTSAFIKGKGSHVSAPPSLEPAPSSGGEDDCSCPPLPI